MSRINSSPAKYAILFFGCVLLHVVGTWSVPLIDRDEPRFAEASREQMKIRTPFDWRDAIAQG